MAPEPVYSQRPTIAFLLQVLWYPITQRPIACACGRCALTHVYDAAAQSEGVNANATTKTIEWREVVFLPNRHDIRKQPPFYRAMGEVDILTERFEASTRQVVWIVDRFINIHQLLVPML